MILLHLFVHLEAVLVLIIGKSYFIEKVMKRAFVLAEGTKYENNNGLDVVYKILTVQDILTHVMNLWAVLPHSQGLEQETTLADWIVIFGPFLALQMFFRRITKINFDRQKKF